MNMNTNINELLKCLNCGSCVKDCPQYKEAHKETKSPRGKIRNIKYAYEKAQMILRAHRDKLDMVAEKLLEKEVINEEEFEQIFE